jgi:cytochrome P450
VTDAGPNLDDVDFFTDLSVVDDPYPLFEHLRSKGKVVREPHQQTAVVTGYDEVAELFRRSDVFSSCNAVVGPFAPFPVKPDSDDLTAFVAANRHQLPMQEHFATMDPPDHTKHRSILMRLLTPKRMKENEDFMWQLADEQLETFLERGSCEFVKEYAQPFALLVVARILGVPDEDYPLLLHKLGHGRPADMVSVNGGRWEKTNGLEFLEEFFIHYIEDRRREPRQDVLTDLATATFPDGSLPDVLDAVRPATFLFAAGQETTARLIATAVQVMGERPDIQEQIRADRDFVENFVEECLRTESPVKANFRFTTKPTRIGDVELAAGTTVALMNGAANRDPERFEDPGTFRIDRPNAKEHLAFGRGIHACPGGSLARAEARVSVERILDRMGEIRISEEHHGPAGDRSYRYEPTFLLRGLQALHVTFTPR